jgi:Rrf2 family cysteine metabolism transcriptional repressor
MKISQKSEYALRAIFDLSLHEHHGLVKSSCIASRQRIPQKFLEQILGNLKQGGLVETRRGPDGGFRLTRPANQITVGEVLLIIECGRDKKRWAQDVLTQFWCQVDKSIASIIDGTTFADLVKRWKDTSARHVPNLQIWSIRSATSLSRPQS